jgi:solute:Na+ symporter, SSS family
MMGIWILSGLAGYFALLYGISIWSDRHEKRDMNGYFLASHGFGPLPIALSFTAAWFAASSTHGMMNHYTRDGLVALWFMPIPSVLSLLLTTVFFAKRVSQQQILTMPEAVERHYGSVARVILALILLMGNVTCIAAQLVAIGQLLGAATGLGYLQAIIVVLLPVMGYCMIGGFRAVVLTDFFQLGLLTTALLLLWIPGGTIALQNPQQLWAAWAAKPAVFWQWSNQPWWAHLASSIAMAVSWSIGPEMWQRMTSAPSPKAAVQAAAMASGQLIFLMFLVFGASFLGLAALPPDVQAHSGAILLELAKQLPGTALGVIVVFGFLAAVTSSLDTMMNIGSLTVVHDLYHRFVRPQASMSEQVWASRLATVLVPLPALLIALQFRDIIKILWLSTDLYACTLVAPVVGLLYLKQPGRLAGTVSMCVGGAFGLVLVGRSVMAGGAPFPTYLTLVGVMLSGLAFIAVHRWERHRSRASGLDARNG